MRSSVTIRGAVLSWQAIQIAQFAETEGRHA